MFCKVEKCTNKVLAKGLCSKHYTTLRRYGTLEKPIKLIEYRKLNKNNTTGFKGVTKKRNKYVAQIKINYNTIRLGSFDTAEEAAIEYNKAAKKYGGRFATLNVVED